MNHELHVCVDKLATPKSYRERLALAKGKTWGKHAQISVAFLTEPSPSLAKRIEDVAKEWTVYAGVTLLFGSPAKYAQIRIDFQRGQGSWSYIGKDCDTIPENEPTMNLGWLTDESRDDELRRVVLHEFGHALGCIHEHQNPAVDLKWNRPVVYQYYEESHGWTRDKVDHNLFETYDRTLTAHSAFDPKSIMLYPIPEEHLLEGPGVGWNTELSETDKAFIAEMYPKP